MRPALAALLLAACTPFASAPDAPDEDAPDPGAAPSAAIAPAPEAAGAALPPGFEGLGGPCPEERVNRVMYHCNADGRVALAHLMVHPAFTGEPPPEERLPPMPPGTVRVEGAFQVPVSVFVDSERVWVAGACVHCRMPTEELRIVQLPLAVDEQIASVQAVVGLPAKPVLRTAAAWREAVDGRPKG
jgi:hypothetical protein